MKILLITMNKADATSFYRAAGVVRDLESQTGITINVQDWQDQNIMWPVLINYDLVWMQRPVSNEAVNTAKYMRQMGIPLWVEYDDDLFNLPTTHDRYSVFQAARQNIITLLQMAAVVTVSTPVIKESYEPYNDNIVVIPNAIQDEMLVPAEVPVGRVMLYRGMKSHEDDVFAYNQHFRKIISSGAEVVFMTGFNPLRYLGRCTIIDSRDIYHYFNYLRDTRPLAFLFPMIENQFNRSRSNICWLEATMAGSVIIAPDWPEFHHPGIIHCNEKNFHEVATAVWNGKYDTEDLYHKSYNYIADNLKLSTVNKMRVEIINNITNGKANNQVQN